MEKNAYYKYQEHRAQAGYGAAILVKEQTATKYSLLAASETVPSIFGSIDSFEFDLLNSPVKGKVAGKTTLDDKEVEVLHHRDNVYRFEQLKGEVLDFLYVDSQFVGYKFSGTLSYRVNDATADVLRGTYTITPMSADPNPIFDTRPLCQETLCFADPIPETVNAGDDLPLDVVQNVTVKYSYITYDTSTSAWGNTWTELTSSTSGKYLAPTPSSESTLYAIKVEDAATSPTYAPWTTTVYINKATTT